MVGLVIDYRLLDVALVFGQINALAANGPAGLHDLQKGLRIKHAHDLTAEDVLRAAEVEHRAGGGVELLDLKRFV